MSKEEKEKQDTNLVDKGLNTNKKSLKQRILIGGLGVGMALGLFVGMSNGLSNEVNTKDDIQVEEFSEMKQMDVIIVDQGIVSQDEGIAKFVKEYSGQLGVHIYENEDTGEKYALISGEEGMEPLTVMLYGVVEREDNHLVIGYNFVESSPQFQIEIPTMLVKVEAEEGVEISGRMVVDEEYESYEDVLKRYKGDEQITNEKDSEPGSEEVEDTAEDITTVEEDTAETDDSDSEPTSENADNTDDDDKEGGSSSKNKYGGNPIVINNKEEEELEEEKEENDKEE